jgi:hypothetical protein
VVKVERFISAKFYINSSSLSKMTIDISKNLEEFISSMDIKRIDNFTFVYVGNDEVDDAVKPRSIQIKKHDYDGEFYEGALHRSFVNYYESIGKFDEGNEEFNSLKNPLSWSIYLGSTIDEMVMNGVEYGNQLKKGSTVDFIVVYAEDQMLYMIMDEAVPRLGDPSGITRGFDVVRKLREHVYRPENEGKEHLGQGTHYLSEENRPLIDLTASWDFKGNAPPTTPAEISKQKYGSTVLLHYRFKDAA